jgi:hypothetical protein
LLAGGTSPAWAITYAWARTYELLEHARRNSLALYRPGGMSATHRVLPHT